MYRIERMLFEKLKQIAFDQVIRMLLLMLVVFAGGWAPKQIYLLLESFNAISQIGRIRTLGILEALLYLQAAIEPYIAIGMSA